VKKILLVALLAVLAFSFAPLARAQDTWLPRPSGVAANLWSVASGNNQ